MTYCGTIKERLASVRNNPKVSELLSVGWTDRAIALYLGFDAITIRRYRRELDGGSIKRNPYRIYAL